MVVVPRSMAMPWIGPLRAVDLLAVDQDAVAVARDRRIELRLLDG